MSRVLLKVLMANSKASFRFISPSLYSCFSIETAFCQNINLFVITHIDHCFAFFLLSECLLRIWQICKIFLNLKKCSFTKFDKYFFFLNFNQEINLQHCYFQYKWLSILHNFHWGHSDKAEIHSVYPSPCIKEIHQKVAFLIGKIEKLLKMYVIYIYIF